MRLYHGTSSVHLDDIKRNGLKSWAYTPGRDGVYLTNVREIAEEFADIKVGSEGGQMVLCEVDADPRHFTADLFMFDLPPDRLLQRYGCGSWEEYCPLETQIDRWDEKIRSGEIKIPGVYDWKKSLKLVNSVVSMEPIPPERVRCRVI